MKNIESKTNNSIKLIIIIATLFMVWGNVQNVTLNAGGSWHAFNSFLCSSMLFTIIIGFGYLSNNNNFSWKEYWKLLFAIIFIFIITSFMYLDFFAFKEGYVSTGYIIWLWVKVLFFHYGKWVFWIILGGSALLKLLTNRFSANKTSWLTVQLVTVSVTIILFLVVTVISIYFQIATKKHWYINFNEQLFYISFREGGFLQIIPGVLAFLIGVNLRWWVNCDKLQGNIIIICVSLFLFVVILSLRMIFNFPILYWDITAHLQALLLLIPFTLITIKNNKKLDFLFYGIIFIAFFHIAFNKVISVEFMIGLLIRVIFGLSVARRAEEFVNNNLFIALVYSLTKVLILVTFCASLSKQYTKLFKFNFIVIEKQNLTTKK